MIFFPAFDQTSIKAITEASCISMATINVRTYLQGKTILYEAKFSFKQYYNNFKQVKLGKNSTHKPFL